MFKQVELFFGHISVNIYPWIDQTNISWEKNEGNINFRMVKWESPELLTNITFFGIK